LFISFIKNKKMEEKMQDFFIFFPFLGLSDIACVFA